jgi:cobaltochelatase CobN
MASQRHEYVETKRHVLGQVVLCIGCCCGRTDKERPDVPEARIKAAWKAEKLNRTIQLTISGCLGPCDVANVVQIITPHGTNWLGRLSNDAHYDTLIEWARACHASKTLAAIPGSLVSLRFEGYVVESETE